MDKKTATRKVGKNTKVEPNPYREVWEKLSKVDCSEQSEKKMGLTYLSWAWAWGILMENFPDSQFEVVYFKFASKKVTNEGEGTVELLEKQFPYEVHPDGTVTVWVKICVNGVWRKMWLPVMDHRNNAVKGPNARQISDTTMRCLVKGLGLFGLGHYIYAGEDLPPGEKETAIADPVVIPIKSTLAHLLKGWEEVAQSYMVKIKWIKEGQTWKDISDENAKKVIDRKDSFKEKAEKHVASRN